MRVIMVMFDSLNRHLLPPYGCEWVHAPNFARLAQRSVTFDCSYVCSMPCMPARRDMHTGRPNFLHRSWGPLEPFDDSMPCMLKQAGISSHLITDHYHYWEPGGATYHPQYSTYEFIRGQSGDLCLGQVGDFPADPLAAGLTKGDLARQDRINRRYMTLEKDHPQLRTFKAGLEFIERNCEQQNWFLQIETFDPHEPFFSHRKYKDRYPRHYGKYRGRHLDWPHYDKVKETPEEVEHCRHEYASLVSMCDAYLGDVLDAMDRHDMWKDTMLCVWTDHGFCLGEHDSWAKCWLPFWEEIARTPFFVWDPRSGRQNERRQALVQPSLDIAPTLLRFFGQEPTADMLGRDLAATIDHDAPVREAGIFGMHGGHVNVTDGRYVYMRGPADAANAPLFDYTLMPVHMRACFQPKVLRDLQLTEPFSFTKGCRLLKIDSAWRFPWPNQDQLGTRLFDLEKDPGQLHPLTAAAIEQRMQRHLINLMQQCEAPPEQYERLGLKAETA